jgi:hypothetical protein
MGTTTNKFTKTGEYRYEVTAMMISAKVAIKNHVDLSWCKDYNYEFVPSKTTDLFDAINIDDDDFWGDDPEGKENYVNEDYGMAIKFKCPDCGKWQYEAIFSEYETLEFVCNNCNVDLEIVSITENNKRFSHK